MRPFTVVIPAHDEATVIGNTLRKIYRGLKDDVALEVLVICNGCRDDTAAVARKAAPRAKVVELATGSKSLALNTGLSLATHRPILFVDADVRVGYQSLAAVADALRQDGVMAASPAANLVTHESDALVKAYYRVWKHHPYLREGVGGSGVVGLSEAGLAQLGNFPSIIADDTRVRALFPLSAQRRVSADGEGQPVLSNVLVPKTISNLISCESRWRSGDAQLQALDPSAEAHPGVGPASFRQLWGWSPSPFDFFIYCGIKAAGRLLYRVNSARGRAGRWHRDESRRRASNSNGEI
jgi:hypothetical protein